MLREITPVEINHVSLSMCVSFCAFVYDVSVQKCVYPSLIFALYSENIINSSLLQPTYLCYSTDGKIRGC